MNLPEKFARIIFLVLIGLSFSSCSKKDTDKIIPREEFINIVTDLHYADAIIANRGFANLQIIDSMPSYYHFVLEKYNVTQKRFDLSLSFYSENMDDFLAIYDQVIKNINNKTPKKLSSKSIYKIFDLALEDAQIRKDPAAWFGISGKVLWSDLKTYNILNKDSLKLAQFSGKLKYQCMLMLKADILVEPEDSSRNIRMFVKINYKDSTFDLKEKAIKPKDKNWDEYQLFIKTDSTKRTRNVECSVFKVDSLIGKKHVLIKAILLNQYPHNMDTTLLIKKEKPTNAKIHNIKRVVPIKKKNQLK